MDYQTLKQRLEEPSYIKQHSFELLKEISTYTNDKEKVNKGRELVIRALAQESSFTEHRNILYSLVRSVGLFPYLANYLQEVDVQDFLAYELHRPINMPSDFVFHSLQLKIYHLLLNGHNVVLSASTSVGKSLIIDALIASDKYRIIVLVVPTIALIDETRKRISQRFRDQCKVITHPSQTIDYKSKNIFVLTQERVLERQDIEEVDLFVIDEFYKLDLKKDNDGRAVQLNLAFYKLLKLARQFYLIGPHIDYVNGLKNLGHDFYFIPSNFSTVAVNIKSYNYKKGDTQKLATLMELCDTQEGAILIYCQSPNSVNTVAVELIKYLDEEEPTAIQEALGWIASEYHEDWIFAKALQAGIGIHHGGIPRALQQYVLKLFNDKKLRILICTSTIIEGVNTVAKNVIVYDRRKNKRLLDYFTYKNIEGRAGRMGQYFVGNVISLETPPGQELSTVNIPIGEQNEKTPLNLLLHLDEEDLTEESQLRINEEINLDLLSIQTIKENLAYTPDQQQAVASTINADRERYHPLLTWADLPDQHQLRTVCQLIFDHLETNSLRNNSILSGNDLMRHLVLLLEGRNYQGYLHRRLEEEMKSPSDIIENSLKVIRHVFSFSFPRALRALERIQRDVFVRANLTAPGSYDGFASQIEYLFMNPIFFALDEYGIPLQTAQKLDQYIQGIENLDDVLERVKELEVDSLDITNFEKAILKEMQTSI